MAFETEADVLAWYESEERVLTKDFLDKIPWQDVRKHPVDPTFIPVIAYMRDIEKATSVYYKELKATPTWKDPSVRRFMDRWVSEEPMHGDLLNRFLEEAGYPSGDDWFEQVLARTRLRPYRLAFAAHKSIAHCLGRRFAGMHMTVGAINELTTLTGYQRLWTLAKHPVLEQILRGIAREEARHYFFYWSAARLALERSGLMRRLNRALIKKFWVPVGQGIKTPDETDQVVRALFSGDGGVELFDRQVNARMAQLPGLAGLKVTTERIAKAASIG